MGTNFHQPRRHHRLNLQHNGNRFSGIMHGFYVGQPNGDFTIRKQWINMETHWKLQIRAAAVVITELT